MFTINRYHLQPLPRVISFHQGDRVRYIGSDPQVQRDYGNQELTILALDCVQGISVCQNLSGQRLIGVQLQDLEPMA